MRTKTKPRTVVGLFAVVVGMAFIACDIEEGDDDELGEDRALVAPPPDLTLAALVQNNNQLSRCGTGTVSVTVDEVNLGPGGVGQFWIHLLDATTGQPAAGGVARPALAGNTSRTSTLTFNPYLGPCDTTGQCIPVTRTYDLYIDGGNLWPESDETNNRLGTLTYTTDCSLPPGGCPPLVCPTPVEPVDAAPFEPGNPVEPDSDGS